MATFVDKITICTIGGHGGPGCSSFRREKYIPNGGPDGGDGGRGGSVILQVSDKLQTLLDLKLKTTYKAKVGGSGRKQKQFGSNGKDSLILVPKGTLIFCENGTQIADLSSIGETYIVAKGGKGGKGNPHFSNSKNRSPTYAQPGLEGETQTVTLELRLISEVGLIGMPNAGKSTLLKVLTHSNPKIAAYPFTTLYPNLGVIKKYDRETVVADIPGLIAGASNGDGLGDEFLRHIDRTKLLIHLVSVENQDPEKIISDYQTIQDELKKSAYNFESKVHIVALSKCELADSTTLDTCVNLLNKLNIKPIMISSLNRTNIDELINKIYIELDRESDSN
ncbi:GTPase ObgE [bacterium]|jgi:GTPase|nr:GTPase ObgE [bacterium]